jgi:hypothetical protein
MKNQVQVIANASMCNLDTFPKEKLEITGDLPENIGVAECSRSLLIRGITWHKKDSTP